MSDNRSHIDEKYQWDLSTVFATDDAWEAELASLDSDLENAKAYKGHLTASSNDLLAITESYLALSRRLEKLYVYASMKNDQDTTVAKYQEYQAKATAIYAKFSEIFAFYEPELMQLSKESFEDFVAETPALSAYAHFFEQLFKRQPHVLSQAEEELLAGAQEIFGAAGETFGILDNADIIFPIVLDDEGKEIQLTHGNFISLLESKNRDVRKEAYQALYATYEQFQHTYAKTLQTNVKVHNYEARVHHFKSAREAALSANFIPESVYDTLIETVNANLPLLHRYVELRKKILKLDDLRMYDIHTPLSEMDMSFTYEEALAKAEDVLAVFGKEYSERVHRAFTECWIDVHVNKGKRSGAYSGGSYDTNAFMLLNWQDTLDNLFTLVHETGHSLHSTFTRENQPYVYGDYSIFLAEIASTTNENILTETLLKEVDDDKARFAILNHYLDGFKSTIFRQAQFAEFEDIIHKADQAGEVLTSDYLNQLYADLNEKYYGLSKADNPEIQYEWARIPHFYYNYYVYQYATGFAAASYLADKVVHGTQADIDRYLDYLKAGNSDYPLNVIKKAGVDMTTSAYLDAAFRIFEERLDELEALIEKGAHL
ncbi:oligoendopeptidase F [Streptococcus gallolyticus subsp. gallolyticus]|uniref:oligoendopeptidase F n=1 Tax=Streptococcus gallolyticus TaxID=315405 RepID=UPI002001A6CF|nr:oligoendopeptidase F [Streptococcus gallolyticus]MCY7155034.1 oligoendopeptidase F [Streptococcus gallolyticus subsp. gallolyticus]MCY7173069.1 oligoendopeptidase F [Streptococcus gallolyticus subsp. gallolyticus]MCY7177240.1 oligoendopeptidase F [Streptococcus gallolyticus subsp. gallolyticus]MCY7181034.1 oligoendopeptidase F [Streptococcus gallolyticus subsp. gallolyticus]MCY7198835.1 oligoendopeptidase F [Streptococcus gallolyticus subsp. gallolyticus]